MTSRKRRCKFSEGLEKEFPYLKRKNSESTLQCTLCNGEFSICSGGKNDIKRHLSSERHKNSTRAIASSFKVNDFFKSANYGTKERELAMAEAVLSFHTTAHNHSYRSMDCTSKLLQVFYDKKFSCARTKTEAIVKNVLAPYSLQEINCELDNVEFISCFSDASNHRDLKLFPFLIRYFDERNGVTIKLIDFINLPGETSEQITNALISILEENALKDKLIAYCADNANTNFGGINRRGSNNVFSRLQDNLNRKIVGVGCAAHIVHNAIQTAADVLPVDIESIIIKIYGHFYIYTVRVEKLKEFCFDVEVQYKKILGYSKTRWLALMPAIERVLKMFEALKAFFLSEEKCPNLLFNFFSDPTSEVWLIFLHNQTSVFYNTIKFLEKENLTIIEAATHIDELITKYNERFENKFIPVVIRKKLSDLVEGGNINFNKSWFINHIKVFYQNCAEYLKKWTRHFEEVSSFTWISLRSIITEWNEVNNTLEYICSTFKDAINENECFDEFCLLKCFLSNSKIEEWNKKGLSTDERWVEVFENFKERNIPYKNLKKIVEFGLALPGTNASTERVFSIINKIWLPEKTQLTIETLKAMLMVKINLNCSCENFLSKIQDNDILLKKIHSVEKYIN